MRLFRNVQTLKQTENEKALTKMPKNGTLCLLRVYFLSEKLPADGLNELYNNLLLEPTELENTGQ